MKTLESLDYIVFFSYFLIVLAIALYASIKPKGKSRNTEDYFLAGRNLPWWIIGTSLIASNISTEQIIGMNGTAFESGIAVISYSLIGGAISILIVGKYFLPMFLKEKIYSMPEFLERRYGSNVSITMGVFWILVFVFVNLTSVLSLGAITLEVVLGIPIIYSVIFLAFFSGIYTIYGGLSAIAWTDFIQVGVLIIGGISVVWLGLDEISIKYDENDLSGGFSKLLLSQADKFHTILPATHDELPWTGVFLGGLWIAALSYWGCNQYIIQRALAAKNLKEAQYGLLFASVLSIIISIIIVFPGLIASELYGNKITARDEAFPFLIRELLPRGYSGLVIAALIASIISSLNSICNSVATIFTMDIYKKLINPKAADYKLILTGRIVTAIALILAVMVAPTITKMGRLFSFIQEYSGFVTPGVLCIFLLGLFWKKTSSTAALSVILLTIPISVLFKYFIPELGFLNRMSLTFIALLLIALILSIKNKTIEKSLQILYRNDISFKTSIIFNIGSLIIISLTTVFYIVFS
tara:strand:- start:4092 stop:5669 length:1578 start_codon:yes stop_codon:yes gene_type:complete